MIEPRAPQRERLVWGVAALVHAVADTLAARYASCTVRGELSGFTKAGSGHCYLSLKDADGGNALLRCAMFRRTAAMLDFVPTDGQLVEVRGRVAVYEPRGDLQFVVEAMRPAGAGALFEQFLRLKARLEAEGLFDADLKRPLPPFPRTVGVVTSLGAAALHDVLTALRRRAPHVAVVLYPSLVQGADAPASLVAAIESAGQRAEVDALIVCRGGGSLEDLWSFNDERVVRAIAGCPIPVVCGVGHETDITLSDLAADVRAPTPTAAAELVAPTRDACLDDLAGFASAMSNRVHQVLDTQAQRLDRATLRLMRPADGVRRHAQRLTLLAQRLGASTRQVVRTQSQRHDALSARLVRAATVSHAAQPARLDALAARLQRAVGVAHDSRHARLAALGARLEGLDPKRVLSRGYAWLEDAGGQAVTSAASLSAGQAVRAVLADGEVSAEVTQVVMTSP
jgi:exodeoxyribonuclease VII large subunit